MRDGGSTRYSVSGVGKLRTRSVDAAESFLLNLSLLNGKIPGFEKPDMMLLGVTAKGNALATIPGTSYTCSLACLDCESSKHHRQHSLGFPMAHILTHQEAEDDESIEVDRTASQCCCFWHIASKWKGGIHDYPGEDDRAFP